MSGDDYVEALICRRPIIVRRRVVWSECDPAGVVYTGRFCDYAASAYGWFLRSVMNEGATLASSGFGTPMKAVSFEFHRMLWPDDWFNMTVRVTAIRNRSFDIEVDALSDDKEPIFTASLAPIFIDNLAKASCAIPDLFRQKLDQYQNIGAIGVT